MKRKTELIELAETHNLALSVRRVMNSGPYDHAKWKRALYHALAIAQISNETLSKIREALELP